MAGPLSTPFGNGPSDLQSPIPGQTMGQALGPAPSAPGRAPAATPNPQPTTPPPAAPSTPGAPSAPSGMSDDDAKALQDLNGMAPNDKDALSALQGMPGPSIGDILQHGGEKVRDVVSELQKMAVQTGVKGYEWLGNQNKEFVKNLPGTAGSLAGGETPALLAAAFPEASIPAAGLMAAGVGMAGAGQFLGDKVMNMVDQIRGIEDPHQRSMMSSVLTGMLSRLIPQAGGAFLEGQGAQWGGQEAMNTAANAASKAYLPDAQAAGVSLLPGQTAPNTAAGQNQLQVLGSIMRGDKGDGVLAQLEQKLNDQKQGIASAWQGIKDKFGGMLDWSKDNQVDLSQTFKPHQAISDTIDTMRTNIKKYKDDVLNNYGDVQVDPTEFLSQYDNELEKLGLMKDGQPTGMNTSDKATQELIRQRNLVKAWTNRDAGAFRPGQKNVPEYVEPFGEPYNIDGGSTHVQDPLSSPGRGPTYSPRADSNALPGSGDQMQFDTLQTHPGSSPGDLGPQDRTDVGFQPGLPGGSYQQPSGPGRLLPPVESGSGQAGIPIKRLDGLIDAAQDYWKMLSQQGDPRATKFGAIQGTMNKAFYGAIDDASASRFQSPELQQSVDMLKRHNQQYSTRVDSLLNMSNTISQNPYVAADQLIRPEDPDGTQMLFHSIPKYQGDQMRGLFMDKLTRDASDNVPGRLFDANQISKKLNQFTPEALDTIFDGNYDSAKSILNTAKAVQNTPITAASGPKDRGLINNMLAKAFGSVPADTVDGLMRSFSKNKDLYDYISSPDYADKIVKYRDLQNATRGYNSTKPFVSAGINSAIQSATQRSGMSKSSP